MKERNTITPIIYLLFVAVIINICSISVAKNFDWILCAISLSFTFTTTCLQINAYKISENSQIVMDEKMKLYR